MEKATYNALDGVIKTCPTGFSSESDGIPESRRDFQRKSYRKEIQMEFRQTFRWNFGIPSDSNVNAVGKLAHFLNKKLDLVFKGEGFESIFISQLR